MQRRTYLTASGATLAAVMGGTASVSAVLDEGEDEENDLGEVGVLFDCLSSEDALDFDALTVTVEGLTLYQKGAANGRGADNGPVNVDVDDMEIDLVEGCIGVEALADEPVPAGEYSHMQVNLSDEVEAEKDGESVDVATPGDAPLQFKKDFEVEADNHTVFTAAVVPIERGNNGYVLRPVPEEVEVTTDDENTEY